MKKIHILLTLIAAASIVTGCGKGSANDTTSTAPADVPPALASVFTTVATDGALKPIPELRQTAKPGDKVIFEAKVMGTERPFVDSRAAFVAGDEGTLTSCDLRHSDGCETPWDACCDEPEALRAGTATVQVVDDAGKVLRHDIKGVSGLKELTRLRVTGIVAPHSSPASFIVNATGIEIL